MQILCFVDDHGVPFLVRRHSRDPLLCGRRQLSRIFQSAVVHQGTEVPERVGQDGHAAEPSMEVQGGHEEQALRFGHLFRCQIHQVGGQHGVVAEHQHALAFGREFRGAPGQHDGFPTTGRPADAARTNAHGVRHDLALLRAQREAQCALARW